MGAKISETLTQIMTGTSSLTFSATKGGCGHTSLQTKHRLRPATFTHNPEDLDAVSFERACQIQLPTPAAWATGTANSEVKTWPVVPYISTENLLIWGKKGHTPEAHLKGKTLSKFWRTKQATQLTKLNFLENKLIDNQISPVKFISKKRNWHATCVLSPCKTIFHCSKLDQIISAVPILAGSDFWSATLRTPGVRVMLLRLFRKCIHANSNQIFGIIICRLKFGKLKWQMIIHKTMIILGIPEQWYFYSLYYIISAFITVHEHKSFHLSPFPLLDAKSF